MTAPGRLHCALQAPAIVTWTATTADAQEAEMTTHPIDRRTAVKLMAAAAAAAIGTVPG